jgi:hypothetical protein
MTKPFPTRWLAAALLVPVLLGACASAGKRLEQGQTLEQQGRPVEAARRYIDALKKDPSLGEARLRLQDAGDRAVVAYLSQSRLDEDSGRLPEAAEGLLRLDDLRSDAAAVGVRLAVPADYGSLRAATLAHAVDHALDRSQAALQARDFAGALRWLAQAGDRWDPLPEQRERVQRMRYDAQLAWGEGELQAGRFRSAFEHAAQAAAIPGFSGGDAEALQREALERGTVRVAIFPVGVDPVLRRRLPQGLQAELNDVLALQQWQRPPQWLDVLDPRVAAREARRRMYDTQPIPVQDASYLGRNLGTRLVVVMELDSLRVSESGVETQRRVARTRAGVDTAFTVRSGRADHWARVSWEVAEAEGWRGVVERGSATAHDEQRFRRAEYAGDWRTLELSSADRALFERGGEASGVRVRELAGELAQELGRDIFAALLRRVN